MDARKSEQPVSRLRRLLRDRRGSAAIEFAFIAPVLLTLYFTTMEVSQGIEINKKVARAGSLVADLITQQQSITKGEIDAIMAIAEGTLQPYGRSKPEIIVTAVEVTTDPTPKTRVVWSRKLTAGAYGAGAAKLSTTTLPAKLTTAGTFMIRVESKLAYKPVVTWTAQQKAGLGLAAAFDNINMSGTYYLRPRMTQSITCADC